MTAKTILEKYTSGDLSLEEANAALKRGNTGLQLDPEKNAITDPETQGLLDTGTGTMDRVTVRDGVLEGCDIGDMWAVCIYRGKAHRVNKNLLID